MLTHPNDVSADQVQSRSVVTSNSLVPPAAGKEGRTEVAVTAHFVLVGVTSDDCDEVHDPASRARTTPRRVLVITPPSDKPPSSQQWHCHQPALRFGENG